MQRLIHRNDDEINVNKCGDQHTVMMKSMSKGVVYALKGMLMMLELAGSE